MLAKIQQLAAQMHSGSLDLQYDRRLADLQAALELVPCDGDPEKWLYARWDDGLLEPWMGFLDLLTCEGV